MPNFLPNDNPLSYLGVRPETPAETIVARRAPASTDKKDIGTIWVDKVTGNYYVLVNYAAGVPTWTLVGGSSADVATLTGDSGGAISPTAGTIVIAGGTNITTVGTSSPGTITVNLDSAVSGLTSLSSGTLAATTTITAGTNITSTAGNITATNGNLVLNTIGNGIQIKSGSNARIGTATLVGGTVTVANTSVTANTRIFLTRASVGATGAAATGNLVVGTVTPATSFVINSVQATDATALQATDVSVINWMLVESIP